MKKKTGKVLKENVKDFTLALALSLELLYCKFRDNLKGKSESKDRLYQKKHQENVERTKHLTYKGDNSNDKTIN